MAIITKVETIHGENRELYLRVNNVEVVNHNVPATATIRGFTSREAYESKKHYIYENVIDFNADVSGNLWEQAYNAFCDNLGIENNQV